MVKLCYQNLEKNYFHKVYHLMHFTFSSLQKCVNLCPDILSSNYVKSRYTTMNYFLFVLISVGENPVNTIQQIINRKRTTSARGVRTWYHIW